MVARQQTRLALRDATSDWHARVDAVFSTADLADRTGYGRFLSAQAAAHLPVEAMLDDSVLETVIPDWRARRRAELLRSDLDAMGLGVPSLEPAPVLVGIPALLGAAYVLEGSRLGGAMLRRSVPPEFPSAFLGTGNSAAWRGLICLLDERLRSEEEVAAAIGAACGVFALFERSGRRFLESGPEAWRTEANRST